LQLSSTSFGAMGALSNSSFFFFCSTILSNAACFSQLHFVLPFGMIPPHSLQRFTTPLKQSLQKVSD